MSSHVPRTWSWYNMFSLGTASKARKKDNYSNDGITMSTPSCVDRSFLMIFALITCGKLLLVPTYHSTDFEVHRNWLAITYNLPIQEWYFNENSPWTLDYPPFFAWFERILSQFATLFDPRLLELDNLNYASFATKIFQRSTVMLTDMVYAYAVRDIAKTFCLSEQGVATTALLALANVGLIIVDHVHFQYNGFLLGILVLSVSRVCRVSEENKMLQGAFWFACLLNLKHIYVYVAPAFGVWLLRWYCFKDSHFISRIVKLGAVVLTVLILSFGPFIHQLPQVMARLFPFKRGLVHAYWAANAWALYTGCDKVLSTLWKRLNWPLVSGTATMTSGLVQESVFLVLPSPTPLATFVTTFVFMLPALGVLLVKKSHTSPVHFVRCVILCGMTSFMFGWHVHEKAILTAIIPLCILAAIESTDAKVFIILSSAGHTAVLPLLYEANLAPLRVLLLVMHILLSSISLANLHGKSLLNPGEQLYIVGLPFLPIYESVIHKLIFSASLPFLPLALTSLYCALGTTYCWIYYYLIFLKNTRDNCVTKSVKNK